MEVVSDLLRDFHRPGVVYSMEADREIFKIRMGCCVLVFLERKLVNKVIDFIVKFLS